MKLSVGMKVLVNLPDNARTPNDPATVTGRIEQMHAHCQLSGVPGMLIRDKHNILYHVDPSWVEPVPLDDASAEGPRGEKRGYLYLSKDRAKERPDLLTMENCPICYEVWGQKPDAKPGENEPVLLASYWDVRDAIRDSMTREQATCNCQVIVANGLTFYTEDGGHYRRSDVR